MRGAPTPNGMFVGGDASTPNELARSFSAQHDRIAGCLTGLLGGRNGFGASANFDPPANDADRLGSVPNG